MKTYLSEYIGTTFLLMIVVGSGIMGQSLSDNASLTLLANTISTGAGLIVLIWMFGNISGAHFNPAVSIVMFANGELNPKTFIFYSLFQILGAISGTLITILIEPSIIVNQTWLVVLLISPFLFLYKRK